jgi:single-strand DNA-binding protein
MAQGDVIVTVVGNITADPELRFTQSGQAVANMTVVKNKRRMNQQTQQWEDAGADFYRVNAWRQLAENMAESLHKGDRVIVSGKLESREWETREGDKRTSWEITADAVGPDLRWAMAQVRKADRQQGGNGYQQQGGYQQGPPPAADPWATAPPQQGYQQQPAYQGAPQGQQQQFPAQDPWGAPPARGGGFSDEPPFHHDPQIDRMVF